MRLLFDMIMSVNDGLCFYVLVSRVTRTVQFPMKSLPFNLYDPVVIYDRATPAAGHCLTTGEEFFLFVRKPVRVVSEKLRSGLSIQQG